MGRHPPSPHGDEVVVWHAEARAVAANADATARAVASLPPADRERYGRYRVELDRQMFLTGRLMARSTVAEALGVGAGDWTWREGPRGRPEIASPATTLRFNLAHSGGLVACAIADGRDVGIDVEHRRRPALDPRLVTRYCAPAEIADIEARQPHWRDRFLTYWTLKEAYLKARGLGIAVPLSEICFSLDPAIRVTFLGSLAGAAADWSFALLSPTDDHVAAVAAPGAALRVVSRPWTPTTRDA
jgi:4'-phosphopantetheinyl transferase